jgi:hypothetical protein
VRGYACWHGGRGVFLIGAFAMNQWTEAFIFAAVITIFVIWGTLTIFWIWQ